MQAKYYLELYRDSFNSYPTRIDIDVNDEDMMTINLPGDEDYRTREVTVKVADFLKLAKMIKTQREE